MEIVYRWFRWKCLIRMMKVGLLSSKVMILVVIFVGVVSSCLRMLVLSSRLVVISVEKGRI